TAIQSGFTSVMMDGSLKADGKTPGDWDYNVGVTKTVTNMAHLGGISVEGELGVLGSLETGMGDKEDGHGAEGKLSHDQLLTNPEEAVKFVSETKVDALAIAMGTSHGAYKFTRKPDGNDGANPKSLEGEPRRIRPAQIFKTGDGGDDAALQTAARGIQYREPSQQDQTGADACRNGQALRQGRTRSEGRVNTGGLSSYPSPLRGGSASESEPGWGF